MKKYILNIVEELKQNREGLKELKSYENHLRDGMRLKYRYTPKNKELKFWEVDAWGRPGREWWITNIPQWEEEQLPEEKRSYYIKEQIKSRDKKLWCFMHDISEDWYNVRNSWAAQRLWKYDQIEEFNNWLEYVRRP